MPRKVSITDADMTWLQEHHQTKTYSDMAKHLNCCVDTLKRILVRHGLQEFDGAKYQLRRDFKEKVWERPCINCGCDEPRPKNWFFCRPCRKELGYDD